MLIFFNWEILTKKLKILLMTEYSAKIANSLVKFSFLSLNYLIMHLKQFTSHPQFLINQIRLITFHPLNR